MKANSDKLINKILILLSLFMLTSCGINNNNDQQIQELKEQVNILSTQNASLLEQDDSESLSAPPPPSSSSVPELNSSVPSPESLPTSPVAAGEPIIYEGWSLLVSQEIIIDPQSSSWGISIFVRNLGETNRVFRYRNSGITAKDNFGNSYEMDTEIDIAGFPRDNNCETIYHTVKNLEIRSNELKEITSGTKFYTYCTDLDGIQMFKGPIPLEVTQLIIHFEEFGPFSNVDVVIEL